MVTVLILSIKLTIVKRGGNRIKDRVVVTIMRFSKKFTVGKQSGTYIYIYNTTDLFDFIKKEHDRQTRPYYSFGTTPKCGNFLASANLIITFFIEKKRISFANGNLSR